jgi:DNA invertase Pin-like site-specific DNA recombinase
VKDTIGLTDVIVYEHSRIGRDMVDVLEFIRHCHEHGISVHIAKSKTAVRADTGGKVISTVMSLAAEIERDLLRSRTKDALTDRKRRIKEEGGFMSAAGNFITKLGRPPGTTGDTKLDGKAEDINKLFTAKVSDSAIARMFDCDRRTVRKMRNKFKKGEKKPGP